MDNENKNGVSQIVKRELIRAVLERVQSTEAVKKAIEEERKTADRYDDIEETLNLPYMNREETPLAMDIFKPVTEDIRELPVIVTIHGGGLVVGDRRLSRPFARELAHKGYLVFSIEFRLAPRANVCQQLDDICAGLDCVGRHLVDYDVDFDRLFLAADSSGAYLAMYAAAMKHSEKLQKTIGYEPTRFVFRALCLSTGMLYTNLNDPCGWLLSDQIYGEKMMDEVFLKYMNPEHPEIINNLPPTIFMTSRGDFLNHYSIMMHEAMKKAGKESRLVYYPDDDLMHAFQTMQTEHPKAKESIDKMLTWFEEQAVIGIERRKEDPAIEKTRRSINRRISRGTITRQPVWKCLREYQSFDPARMRATALIDCTKEYSFEQFFEECERYARVFSALHMSDSDGSRVGIGSTITAEPIFAFYGLNMTGATVSMLSYPDFLPTGQWKEMVEQEKITDLILSDFIVTPDLIRDIERNRERLGIKHVIFLHSRLGGPCTGPSEMIFNEFNYHALKRRPGTVFMDDLLVKYESYPITYAKEDPDHIAVITHTSGTTKGTRKPLPYTDRAVNTVACSTVAQSIPKSYEHIPAVRVAPCFDFSSFMCICGLVNAHLAAAHTIVLTFFGFIHPKYIRGLEYYGVNIVFASGFMIDKWMERPDLDDVDLSAVKIFACGGSYVSPEKYRKYKNFLREHNCESDVLRGYGMSESGAAELSVPENCEEDIIGYPKPKENFRIQDEDDGQFYEVDDGERTGVMYIASDSLCLNTLDGKVLFEYTMIDGRRFICTNDLVRVNANGSFSYAGRADRFFVNNEGIRFDPGVVEVKISAHPAIARCAVVPVLEKRIHDTVPVLYVIPEIKGPGAEERVREALIDVFVGENPKETNLPTQFVIVDDIPCNANGKIDIYRITRDRLSGTAYNIVPVRENDRLIDIRTELVSKLDSITAGTIPEGMENRSAMGIYELLNSVPDKADSKPFARMFPNSLFGAKAWGKFSNMVPGNLASQNTFFSIAEHVVEMFFNKKDFDYYFED